MEKNNLIVYDPNTIFNNIDGGTVSPEQLSINVRLTTKQKERTAIVASGSIDNEDTILSTLGGGDDIDFMAGNKIYQNADTSNLTTFFTEIDSGFGSVRKSDGTARDLETLGIRSINIEFNSAIVPIITIDMVDVRGRLFQYGNESPYRVFFEMPYPIFNLTVKGFYGKAVTYPLHLIDFKARFNSETGSFEIKTQFIGYTYAYLSDLLIGYLKGVPYTNFGKNFISNDPNFVTFSKLDEVALKTRQLVNKIKGGDEIEGIKAGNDKVDALNAFSAQVDSIIETDLSNFNDRGELVRGTNIILLYGEDSVIKDACITLVNSLNNEIALNNINADAFQITPLDIEKIFYSTLSVVFVDGTRTITNDDKLSDRLRSAIKGVTIGDNAIKDGLNFCVLDLEDLKNEINRYITDIGIISKDKTESLAAQLGEALNTLGIEPTIGNYFSILCKHADLLILAIQKVARDAEADPNLRREQFKSILSNVGRTNESDDMKIRAFPEYSVKTNDGRVEERWIGTVAPNIPEVLFVQELINGILAAAREDKDAEKELDAIEDADQIILPYFPIHVFEIPYFNKDKKNPYSVLSTTHDLYDFIRLFFFRAFTFLNSNKRGLGVTDAEIQAMAKIEANNAVNGFGEKLQSLLINSSNDLGKFINENVSIVKDSYGNPNPIAKNPDGGVVKLDTRTNFTYGLNDASSDTFKDVILPLTIKDKNELNLATYLDSTSSGSQRRVELRENGYIFFGSNRPTNQIGRTEGAFQDNGVTFVRILGSEIELGFTPETYGVVTLDEVPFNLDSLKEKEFFDSTQGVVVFSESETGGSSARQFYSRLNPNKSPGVFKTKTNFGKSKYDLTSLNDFLPLNLEFKNDEDLGITNYTSAVDAPFKKRIVVEAPIDSYVHNDRYVSDLKFRVDDKLTSIFGSRLYRGQNNDEAKAFLFLNTIPFAGTFSGDFTKFFSERSAIIRAPKAWVLFIGATLYRRLYNNVKFVGLVNGVEEEPSTEKTVFERSNYTMTLREKNENYANLNEIIASLPLQVEQEFTNYFVEWVKNGFQELKSELEMFTTNATESQIINMNGELETGVRADLTGFESILNPNFLANYINLGNSIATTSTSKSIANFNLELNPNGSGAIKLTSFIKTYLNVVNGTTEIWYRGESLPNDENIIIEKGILQKYVGFFSTEFTRLKKDQKVATKEETEAIKQELFQTLNGEDIRLKVYKDIKAIYDKWICGTKFNVGEPDLFKTFKFINRSYKDISQEFKINIPEMVSLLMDNYNSPLYTHLSDLLSKNKFNFMALPNYVDLTSKEGIENIFKPTPWVETVPTISPTFICMYTGELSNTLDLGPTSNFKDNGVSLDKEYIATASDFNQFTKDSEKIPIFLVRFGDQNQSIFKEVQADQSEFTNSNESLQITDVLAKGQAIGQNLFDIFQNRSYTINVEMMGNVMIQPFMYAMVENIPMFKGLYCIFKVSHSITPGSVMTSFKAYRVRDIMTKMVDDETLFNAFFSDLSNVKVNDKSLAKLSGRSRVASNGSDEIPGSEITAAVPRTAVGLQAQRDDGNMDRYAILEVKDFILELAKEWNSFAKSSAGDGGKQYNDTLYYNDLSKQGGGTRFRHGLHKNGVSWDVRQIAFKNTNGSNYTGTLDLNHIMYSQKGTEEFIQMANNLANSSKYKLKNGQSFIKRIYFNSSNIRSKFSNVGFSDGHNNHMHFEFNVPDRIQKNIDENNVNTTLPVDENGAVGLLSKTKYKINKTHEFKKAGAGKITTKGLSAIEKAFLDVIAYAEGTSNVSQNGYDVALGYYLIEGYTKNTTIKHGENKWYKELKSSNAAGRYQFLGTSWADTSGKNIAKGNVAFSASNQDLKGVARFRIGTGSLNVDNIITDSGGFNESHFGRCVDSLKGVWTSFKLPENSKSILFGVFKDAYNIYNSTT